MNPHTSKEFPIVWRMCTMKMNSIKETFFWDAIVIQPKSQPKRRKTPSFKQLTCFTFYANNISYICLSFTSNNFEWRILITFTQIRTYFLQSCRKKFFFVLVDCFNFSHVIVSFATRTLALRHHSNSIGKLSYTFNSKVVEIMRLCHCT